VQEAIDLPRLFAPPSGGPVHVESGIPEASVEALRALGHATTAPPKPIGGAQAIMIDWRSGVLTGGSEPRKDGCALGY
jgi:gamma-glutamyltranspeptidase/glutathione hydrolase